MRSNINNLLPGSLHANIKMFKRVKNFLGVRPRVDLKKLLRSGAVVVDVRSAAEFGSGHRKGSLNIPLNLIPEQMDNLNKDKPIITCCASGMRSASARSLLLSNGFKEVYNAGKWSNLLKYMEDQNAMHL